jgi:hypothetical protein
MIGMLKKFFDGIPKCLNRQPRSLYGAALVPKSAISALPATLRQNRPAAGR